ncbi:MAG TPA: hypothetical protein VFP44_21470, partial [Usitatibacter sp.]|nr:hypothetical protein [Usitatibacter sp.]
MSLVPRSLFGRLVVVLLLGLATAQLIGFAIHMQDRRELLAEASGMRAAQRIADIAKLLDSMPAADRARHAAVLATPRMAIEVGRDSPLPAPPDAERR